MQSADLPLLHFDHFARFSDLTHFVSQRAGGTSQGNWGDLNLSYHVGDKPEHVSENRRRLATALGVPIERLVFARQTHGDEVAVVNEHTSFDNLPEADALITNRPGWALCITAADCVPVLFYDPANHAAGVAHAGWRGTVARTVTRTIKAMKQNFGTDPADVWVGIGPSISPEVYEVGADVIESVTHAYGEALNLISPATTPDKGFLDLWAANREQLLKAGVPAEQIETSGICTFRTDAYFSARRQGLASGRFAGGVLLR
ncbi:MAG: peptidoglycan editing factor PgeF [Catalinimonas sp.]